MKLGLVEADPKVARAVERALSNTKHVLIWHVTSGREAVKRASAQAPDLVLVSLRATDLKPEELTRQLVAKRTAVVLLAAADSELSSAYDAMGAGAIDVVKAPRLAAGADVAGADLLLAKLRTASRLLGHPASQELPAVTPSTAPPAPPLVAIGASTGGPQALLTVLTGLSKPFPGAILLVQHVDGEFSAGLASWLSETSGMRVELARPGSVPTVGVALLAGTEQHLIMAAGGSLRYTPDPSDLPYRPSVDVLFNSLVKHWKAPGVAALLTGMGKDGAQGLKKLRQAGWHTIAQDEATSIVYGMPKAAAQLGAAARVLPIGDVAHEISSHVTQRAAPRRNRTSKRPAR